MTQFLRQRQVFDATNQAVGRLATRVVLALRGKDKADFLPHLDRGDIVEVTNIDKLKFTGKKLEKSVYHHYSGYPHGLKTKTVGEVYAKNPGEVLRRAVREMLPDNRLRQGMMKRLIIK